MITMIMLVVFGFLCYFAYKDNIEAAIICAIINTVLCMIVISMKG